MLPKNQHGFRSKRSTMTAWANIQQEWASNTDEKNITGVLLWDLSAAFDTLDPELLIKKLSLYGFSEKTCSWFKSFLTGRSQRVKIGSAISDLSHLESGVPQGGILSPLIYIIYVADLEDWLIHSSASTYADDTETSVTGQDIKTIITQLEEDAERVLKFMASNGLVANPKKTSLLFINLKNTQVPIQIKVGTEVVCQEEHAKLLGMSFSSDQKWKTHLSGKGGVIAALNQRLFLIKRLKNHPDINCLKKVAESTFISKLRYGLQLLGKVRSNQEDALNQDLATLQKVQNKLLRFLNGVKISDKINTSTLLANLNLLSVNQMNAQIKLLEFWKIANDKDHPNSITQVTTLVGDRVTRSTTSGLLPELGRSKVSKATFLNDGSRLWNLAPKELKMCSSKYSVQKEIKKFVQTLPI